MKVYIATAISGLSKEDLRVHLDGIEYLKSILKNKGFEILDFLSAFEENPEPAKVYNWDIDCLNKADYVLAIADRPSTGLGYEVCYSREVRKIPVMVSAKNIGAISKMLTGIISDKYEVVSYADFNDLSQKFCQFTEKYEK